MFDVSSNHEWWELYFPDGWLERCLRYCHKRQLEQRWIGGRVINRYSYVSTMWRMRSIYRSTIVVDRLEWPSLCKYFSVEDQLELCALLFLLVLREFLSVWVKKKLNNIKFNVGPVFTMDDLVICEAFSVEGQLEFSGCLAVCAPSIWSVRRRRNATNSSGRCVLYPRFLVSCDELIPRWFEIWSVSRYRFGIWMKFWCDWPFISGQHSHSVGL